MRKVFWDNEHLRFKIFPILLKKYFRKFPYQIETRSDQVYFNLKYLFLIISIKKNNMKTNTRLFTQDLKELIQ